MKKLYFTMLLMAGLALSACSSDDNSTEQQQAPKTYYMTVDAAKPVNESAIRVSSRALSLVGSTLNATWATSEKVYVQGTYSNGDTFWWKGFLQPQSAGATTRLNGTITLPDGTVCTSIEQATGETHPTLTLQFPRICTDDKVGALGAGVLDYDGQKGTLADIAAKYDYAIATIKVDVINDRIVPYEETTAVFENQQAIVKFTFIDKTDGTTLLSPSALTISVIGKKASDPTETEEEIVKEIALSSIPNATYTTNGNGVLFVAIPGFSEKKVILTAIVDGNTYTFTKSKVSFVNGEYYELNVKMNRLPAA